MHQYHAYDCTQLLRSDNLPSSTRCPLVTAVKMGKIIHIVN